MTTVPYIPSNQRIDSPWAYVQQLPGGAGVPPGRIGFGAAGKGFDLSGDLHSASVRRVRRCYDADGAIGVEFENDHPFETGELLPCRVGGIDMATMRSHRANNWTGGPLVHVNTLSTDLAGTAGVRLGGDPWTVTRVDDRKVILDGSIWKTDAAHPDPILWSGTMYRELVDAWPSLADAMDFIDGRPGGIQLGMGYFALLAAADTETFFPEADFTLTGAGMELSWLHRGDYFNRIPFHFHRSNFRVAHLTQEGNRPFQKQATHGWKTTTPVSEDESVFDGTFEHVRTINIPGYGANHGHPGGKVRIRWLNCKTIGTGNDGKDFKGPQIANPDGAYGGIIANDYSAWVSLGTAGTNRQESVLLGNNPIATASGLATFTVTLPAKVYVGLKLTFGADVTAVGGLAFAGKTFTVASRAGLVATCTHASTASSTATGGGAAVTVLYPLFLKGKPGNDIRGEGWVLSNLTVDREIFLGQGLRIRGGDGDGGNGVGGHYSTVAGLVVNNTTPDEYGTGAGKGLSLFGTGIQVSNATLRGNGAGQAIILAGGLDKGAVKASLRNIHAESWNIGLNLAGNECDVALTAVDCARAVYVDGGKISVQEEFEDAIDVTTASTIATFHWTGHPLTVGKTVVFDGVKAHNLGGVIVDDGVEYTVASVPDANTFTFDTGQYPTLTVTGGGGDEIEVTVNGVNFYNYGNRLSLRAFECDQAVDVHNRCEGLTIHNSTWDRSGTGIALDTLTTGILMGPGNVGFDNAVPFGKTIAAADAGRGATVTIGDSNTSTRGATVAAGGANVVLARSDGTNWLVV